MRNENNKMQIDIENLFKQNVNDLSAIKELYSKLKEVEEKISQIKYIDSTLAKKLKKEYKKLKTIILDENIQVKLNNDIEKINSELNNKVDKSYIETINSQLDNNTKQLSGRIDTIIANNNTTDGNSELVDIRVGNDGTKYNSAGECVRNIDKKVSTFAELKETNSSSNLYNEDTTQKGSLNMTGVFAANPDSGFICSDYIKLNKGKSYAFSYGHATLGRYHMSFNRFVAYNLSKTFLAQTTSDSNLTDIVDITVNANSGKYTLVVPKQDIYIRFQVGVAITEIMVKNGTDNIYEPYGDSTYNFGIKDDIIGENNLTSALREKINKSNNQDTGVVNKEANCRFLPYLLKKGICIGDSLTEGYHTADDIDTTRSYPAYLSRMMNCDITNTGQSGITTSGWYNAHISKYNYADYDFAIIYLGTNGGMTDTLIQDTTISEGQTYKDYANTNTGCYCKIIETILEQNPKCKIYLIRWDATTTANVTIQIAKKYGLDTINLLDKTYFDCQESKYHTDGTHFNSLGYCNFAWNIYCHINDLIENNQNGYKEH